MLRKPLELMCALSSCYSSSKNLLYALQVNFIFCICLLEFIFSKYIISNVHIFINQSNTLQEPGTNLIPCRNPGPTNRSRDHGPICRQGWVMQVGFSVVVCARCTTDVNSVDFFAMGCMVHNGPLCHLLPYYGLCMMHNGPQQH